MTPPKRSGKKNAAGKTTKTKAAKSTKTTKKTKATRRTPRAGSSARSRKAAAAARTTQGPSWVGMREAADAAGVTVNVVRAWARAGKIAMQPGAGTRGSSVVRLSDVLRQAGRSDAVDAATQEMMSSSDSLALIQSLPEIFRDIQHVAGRAAAAEVKAEFLAERLHERQEEVTDLKLQIGDQERRIAELTARLEERDRQIGQLTAAPEPATAQPTQRRWWRT